MIETHDTGNPKVADAPVITRDFIPSALECAKIVARAPECWEQVLRVAKLEASKHRSVCWSSVKRSMNCIIQCILKTANSVPVGVKNAACSVVGRTATFFMSIC